MLTRLTEVATKWLKCCAMHPDNLSSRPHNAPNTKQRKENQCYLCDVKEIQL